MPHRLLSTRLRPHLARLILAAGVPLLLAGCAATAAGTPADPATGHAPGHGAPGAGPTASPLETGAAPEPGSVWIANEGDDSITVLDAADDRVVATLTGIAAPHNVSASLTRPAVWATAAGGVVGIDTAGLFALHAVPAGSQPAHVVESGYGDVLVTSAGDGQLHRFSSSLEPVRTHEVGSGPHGVRVSADGRTAAVANTDAGTVTITGLRTGGADVTVPVGESPVQVGFTRDGADVFATVAGAREVVRIDVETGEVTGRAAVPSAPAQLWVTEDGTVLTADQGTERRPGSTLSVIDGETMEVVGTVRTGAGPHGVTVDPAESRAWVSNVFDDTVTVVDLESLAAVATLAVGDAPNGVTWSPATPEPAEHLVPLVLPHAFAHPAGAGHHH